MPQRDAIHQAVKNALIKDGWTIIADPLLLSYGDVQTYADLAAERTIAAEKGNQRIVVEVKSFQSPSPIHDFEEALGQYTLYRDILTLTGSDSALYLAVSENAYHRVFERQAIREITERNQMALLVVNLAQEEIVLWTN